ncbi:MAG: hypothetical protein OEY34_02295 [Cyclobacteriaceae bacterium]|nr:hypothetical protein [Cyclobacteriaceae bacterium]
MVETTPLEKLNAIQAKILSLHEQLQQANQLLDEVQKENELLKKEIKDKDIKLKDFQNKFKITNIVKGFDLRDGDNEDVKKKIEEYIGEIDRCIAHLSR